MTTASFTEIEAKRFSKTLTTDVINANSSLKVMLYEVQCLKSNEDMIVALAGQFKQLSYEPEKFR